MIQGYVVCAGTTPNILLDSTTGGVMHVDFNCLFNKVRFCTNLSYFTNLSVDWVLS